MAQNPQRIFGDIANQGYTKIAWSIWPMIFTNLSTKI